jgi:Bacterial surface proteins containing Ig-like domains
MRKSLFIGLVAVLSLFGCSRNQEIDVPDANLSIFAKTESPADTKTVVESGVHVYWEPGDEIAVFTGEQSAKFTTDITAASGTATFKGTFGDATWPEDLDLWAVYPFSEDAVFDGETITTTLPSEQVAREGSFGKDMNLAIAHSSGTTLQFYNVGGGIRFSVTEEGIKKVMFEGLGGEIISGKVKIGMDENGKPEVKEVTGGSQFISLLPPTGQETFETGASYYIVAIPGTLEGGYKLRFYKDSDYARKVSEKAVTIKRSIFGNLEKADEGIEYEATTTHFPETVEDFDYSIEWTKTIGETIDKLIADNSEKPLDSIVAQIESIEGVSFVTTNMAKSTIMVMQKDSVWINYLLDTDVNHFLSPLPHSESRAPALVGTPIIGGGKNGKALILAPFQDSFSQSIDTWKQWLASAFDEVKVRTNTSDTPTEERPEIMRFDGDELSQYNFIIITTHGGTGFYAKMKESIWSSPTGDESSWVAEQTVLASCTKYSKKTVNDLKKHHSVEEIAIVHVDDDYYLAMTPKFLKDLEYKDVGVMLQACSSSQIVDEGHDGSMVQAFLKKKAAFVMGYDKKTNEDLSNIITTDFLYGICKGGLSVRDSYNFWQFSQLYPSMQSAMLLQAHSLGANVKDSALDFRNFKLNEAKEVSPYYTRNWSPLLNTPDITDNSVEYSWTCALSPYEYSSRLFNYDNFTGAEGFLIRTEVFYDVYVDGIKISPPDLSETALKIDSVPSPKNHSWYVVARLMKGDSILASYQSSTEPFTVKEQIPAPPQVETFPASVDAQKAFLSGMVTNRSLEGLETGFYYYKLTAQEESTELSASEKERLVMGGKKILSSGDYKDYFGIDLTDIEQDSKYLFVAYATDEYSQTGKGEVLSFTTGSPSVHVSSVSLNMSSLELGIGNTATLVATVLPENASNKKVIWSSSDESKATVSSQGVVKGISMGNAVITVTTEDGGKTAQCHVSVTQSTVHVQSVSLNKSDLVLTVGNSETLVATVLPENAANKSVTWSSSNPSKATVSSTGVVTGVAEGAAVVTATTVDGGKTASCFVTVRQATQPDPGESGNALIELSCDELDWGDVEIGNNVTKTFTVKNTGTTALNISSVSIVATDNTVNPSYFSILPNSSSTVSPGNSLAFNVTFIPESECGYYAIVSIKSNASNATEGTSTVWLTGVGIKASSSHSGATPEIVDLGLSVKWASFNLGATKPEEYGNYYSWGETEAMDFNSPASYKFSNGAQAFTKYNTDPYYTYLGLGIIDNKTVLDPEDDAAHVILGGNWRIPSKEEIDELIANCTWTWNWTGTTESGLAGYKVVSNIPGYTDKWIFLPAPGDRSGPDLYNAENYGYYWSSALYTDDPAYAYCLFFSPVYKALSNEARHFGISIRPVYDDK